MKVGTFKTTRTVAVIAAASLLIMPSLAIAGAGYALNKEPVSVAIDAAAAGSSTDTGAPCADIACNAGDTCDCMIGSARELGANPTPDKRPHVTSMNYELSIDETAALDDGTSTGKCMPAAGNGVMTLEYDGFADFPRYPVNFLMTGLDCTVPGMAPGGLFNGTIQFTSGSSPDYGYGLGSIKIGDMDGGITEVIVTADVDWREKGAVNPPNDRAHRAR
ncbi:MAG: PE-PPE domain-containing protein [Candidatus Binataceae bacterium]